MPVCATASAMLEVVSFAASYWMRSRWPTTSASSASRPGQPLQAVLEDRHLFVAVHALDLEDRLGVQLADGALGHLSHSSTWVSACLSSSMMC